MLVQVQNHIEWRQYNPDKRLKYDIQGNIVFLKFSSVNGCLWVYTKGFQPELLWTEEMKKMNEISF